MSDVYVAGNRLHMAYDDNGLMWGMVFLEEHFREIGGDFHIKIYVESEKCQFIAIASPRESAKTTIIGFLKPAHKIAFKKKRFIVIVQNTFAKAAQSLDNIKKEFKDNPKLAVFKVVLTRDAQGDSIFRHPDGFEVRVLCKGADQIGSLRGEKFGAYRPDLMIVDDVEDDEMVKNPERRSDLRKLFDEALIPAGDKKRCQFIVIGTVLHDDSLLARLISPTEYPGWRKLKFQARMEVSGVRISLWPDKWSVEDLDKIEAEKPHVFAKEYQNDPTSGLASHFRQEDFRYWEIREDHAVLYGASGEVVSRWKLSDCQAAVAGDLAWEEKRESDYSVLLPALLTPASDVLVDDYICKKGLRPDEFISTVFMLDDKYRAMTKSVVTFGFEKAKLEKVMVHLLSKEERRLGKFVLKKELQWDADKIQRIITRLQARYASHVIYHRKGMGMLESQLIRVPNGVHDDLPDALQGVVQLLVWPKTVAAVAKTQDKFEWWRQQTPQYRIKNQGRYIYGQRERPSPFRVIKACP